MAKLFTNVNFLKWLPEPVFKPQLDNLELLIAVVLEDRNAKAYVIELNQALLIWTVDGLPQLEGRGSECSPSVGTESEAFLEPLTQSKPEPSRVQSLKSVAQFGICVNRLKLTGWDLELSTINVENSSDEILLHSQSLKVCSQACLYMFYRHTSPPIVYIYSLHIDCGFRFRGLPLVAFPDAIKANPLVSRVTR